MDMRRAIARGIATLSDFKQASVSGTRTPDRHTGRLSDGWRNRYLSDWERMVYVVLSYGTPIAWKTDAGWIVPDEKHSTTTSRHQTIVRDNIGTSEMVDVYRT